MMSFAGGLSRLNERWGYTLATCGERIDLSRFHVVRNRCIDDDLIIRFANHDDALMRHLGVTIQEADLFGGIPEGALDLGDGRYAVKAGSRTKDKGQREFCGCIASKDIGEYNTCIHLCEYCYANTSKEAAQANWRRHQGNPFAETITGI